MMQSHGAMHVDFDSYADTMFAKKNGFDRRHNGRSSRGNARCNVTRGRPIIRDQGSTICEGIDKLHFLVAYLQ